MYDDVLLPFDGSEGATAVLRHAGAIARWADATVRVLYVADTARDSVTVVDGGTVDALVRKGERIVEEAAATLEDLGVDHGTDVVQGDPAPTIADYAERYGNDLIVLPTRGREGVSRLLLGSVSERVVGLSAVPVLTARTRPDETLAFPYEAVLVPTDGSAAAERAADHAAALAASLDATLHALSVVDDTALGSDGASAAATASERAAEAAVDAVRSTAADRGVTDVVGRVERGDPVEEIEAYVDSGGVDAVCMGTTGGRGADRILLGGVAERTVRSAPVPVVTVAPPE